MYQHLSIRVISQCNHISHLDSFPHTRRSPCKRCYNGKNNCSRPRQLLWFPNMLHAAALRMALNNIRGDLAVILHGCHSARMIPDINEVRYGWMASLCSTHRCSQGDLHKVTVPSSSSAASYFGRRWLCSRGYGFNNTVPRFGVELAPKERYFIARSGFHSDTVTYWSIEHSCSYQKYWNMQ